MKTLKTGIIFLFFSLQFVQNGKAKEITFTLEDRDRLIRTEQKVESLQNQTNIRFEAADKRFETAMTGLNSRFDSADKRFDQLFNFLWAIIGIFTSFVVALIGFAFWDRKLSISPVKRENERILGVLRDYSKNQPRLTEIMKNAGLL